MRDTTLARILLAAALCSSGCSATPERPTVEAPAPRPDGDRPPAPAALGPAVDLDITFHPGMTTNIGWAQLPDVLPMQFVGAPGALVVRADSGRLFAPALRQAPLAQTSLVVDTAALCSDALRDAVAHARPERLLIAVRGGLDPAAVACLRELEAPRLYLAGCLHRPHRPNPGCDGDAELAALLVDDDVKTRVRGLALSVTPAAAPRLGELTHLEYLALVPGAGEPGSLPLVDLRPLSASSQLRFLDIRALGESVVVDPRVLARLHTLRSGMELFGPLPADCALRRVSSSRLGDRDVEALRPCGQLEELTTDAARFASAAPLARWTGLRRLHLRHWRARDLGPLAELSALEQLSLPSSDATDFDVVARLPALRSLDLSQTALADLGPVRGLAALERLDVGFTAVRDLSPLRGLPLITLDLHHTRVEDIRPLATLTRLEKLSLSATGVRDLTSLADHPALSWVIVRETAVTDVSPLLTLEHLTRAHIGDLSLPPEQVRALRERLGHRLDGVGPGRP